MPWPAALQTALLATAGGLALWTAFVARGRPGVPGSRPFVWLQLGIALWCLTGALHAAAGSLAVQIFWAKIQYLGIAAVPPLFLLFASEYTRTPVASRPGRRGLLWLVPAVTVAMAATNEWHGWLWRAIDIDARGATVYRHGPWFWAALVYNYALVAAGTLVLLRASRRMPAPYRHQSAALVAGAAVPWAGNLAYVAGLAPPGFDPTPLGFAASGLSFAWGLYRQRLFDLVPIARDLLFDHLQDAALVLDPQRRVVDFNRAARALPGTERLARGLDVADAVAWWTEAVASGEAFAGHAITVPTGADTRTLEVLVAPVRGPGERFDGWLIVARDVTARVRADEERRHLDERIRHRERRESLSVLAGGLAHDFNNLLAGILGNAELVALSLDKDSPLRSHLQAIIAGSQRAADLIQKMLASAGEGRAIAGFADIDALAAEVVAAADAPGGLVLRHDRVGPLPPVLGDVAQIRQTIANIVDNALEASPGGGEVVVATGIETLSAEALARATLGSDRPPGTYVYIEVRDQGRGMDEATVARIFDPFFTTKALGRGLGLAAVQGIVRSHDGVLRVDSRPGGGTTFRVWFPVADRPV